MRELFTYPFDFARRRLPYFPAYDSAGPGRADDLRRGRDRSARRDAGVLQARDVPGGDRAAAGGAGDPTAGEPGGGAGGGGAGGGAGGRPGARGAAWDAPEKAGDLCGMGREYFEEQRNRVLSPFESFYWSGDDRDLQSLP